MGENLNLMQALYVTISSMAMVFLILLVISGILSLFKYIFKNENNMSLFELNIVFFNIRYPVKISRNGNAIKMLFIITVNENG